eukprot:CAMPEP_0177651742 /NCGR_PEP_ID=MMETSP0447-20121125/12723_1 /TAXON_ID=0 /ORGANISM="Stygamoeba regulata, Strain BSH-02190019" /LENGTH=549 /DNA_ID=CAMNT_0019154869 /DNA_START=44 /DNA_END=1693 /DNA_ORIENTATION=-
MKLIISLVLLLSTLLSAVTSLPWCCAVDHSRHNLSCAGAPSFAVLPSSLPAYAALATERNFAHRAECAVFFCPPSDRIALRDSVRFLAGLLIPSRDAEVPAEVPGISVRSGRHDYAGFSVAGLVLDVSSWRRVVQHPLISAISSDSLPTSLSDTPLALLTVEAGTPLGEVYHAVSEQYALAFPGGTCPTVATAGLTLGGGYGMLSRWLGLTSDALYSAEVMVVRSPDGEPELVQCNSTSHSELFWALRGAGAGNFGVVTALTFALPRAPSLVTRYTVQWNSLNDLVAVLGFWQSWASSAPPVLTSKLNVYHGSIQAAGWFLGSAEQLAPLLAQLTAVANPVAHNTHEGSYSDAILDYAGCANWTQCAQESSLTALLHPHTWTNHSWYAKTAYATRPLESATIASVARLLATLPPGAQSTAQYMLLDAYGGVLADRPDTAFPWRKALFHIQLLGYYSEPSDALPTHRYLDELYAVLYPSVAMVHRSSSPSSGDHDSVEPPVLPAYRNYCDPALRDPLTSYYGDEQRQRRLRSVKATYDPFDLFRYPQSIR